MTKRNANSGKSSRLIPGLSRMGGLAIRVVEPGVHIERVSQTGEMTKLEVTDNNFVIKGNTLYVTTATYEKLKAGSVNINDLDG